MFKILAALGRISGVIEGVGNAISSMSGALGEILNLGLYGAGGVTLKLSEKTFSAIENNPFFKKFSVNFGSKYMTPFGTTLYWNEIQQLIFAANRQLGLAGHLSQSIEKNIIAAGTASLALGFSEKEITENFKDFINEYDRDILFSPEDLQRITKVSTIFEQSFNKIFATNRLYGQSIQSTYNFLEDLNKTTDRFGLNSKKVFAEIQSNIKLIDKFSFKSGQEGLAKMVIHATKLGLEMQEVAGFADQVYNPEDAIEAAASLQMLGGEFSKLGDPFQLLYNSNNDLETFAKSLAQVTKGMASLNAASGQFELSPLEFRQLREFSKITGQSVENLSKQAKLFAKEDFIKNIIPPDLVKFSNIDEYISKIASLSTFEDGVAKILVDNQQKLVSNLTAADLNKLSKISVTSDTGDSFDGLIISNQTLGDKIGIFSNEFTRAINKFENVGNEIGILNQILLKGNESLRSGLLSKITDLQNKSKEGASQSFGDVLLPMLDGNFGDAFGNMWQNMDLKSKNNVGTIDAMTNILGGPDSMGGKMLNTMVDVQSGLHSAISSLASAVAKFGDWIDKLFSWSPSNMFSGSKNDTMNSVIPSFSSNSTSLNNSYTKSSSFNETDTRIKLFDENEDAREKLEQQLLKLATNRMEINAANSSHKIEFSWNGKVYNVYDLFEDDKFKTMLRKEIGDKNAEYLLSQLANGGKNTAPRN